MRFNVVFPYMTIISAETKENSGWSVEEVEFSLHFKPLNPVRPGLTLNMTGSVGIT